MALMMQFVEARQVVYCIKNLFEKMRVVPLNIFAKIDIFEIDH